MTRSYQYLIITGLLLLLGLGAPVAGASALDGYYYYQTIEYAACDQDIYQQDIVIHRSTGTAYNETAGGLETWHIYVGEHCREDYGDVRFTDSTGAELAYYLWPDYTSSSARFTVRLEGATSAGVLQVWYGNPTATTTSDGTNTYLLFDHFDGAANAAPNPDLWEVVKKGSTSATVKLDGNGNLLLAGAPNTISSGNAWGKPLLSRNVIIEYRDKISNKYYPDTSYGKGGVGGVFDPPGSDTWWHTGLFSAYALWAQDGTSSGSCALQRTDPSIEDNTEILATATSAFYPSLNTFYTHRFEVQSADLKFYRDGVLIASGSDTTYSGNDFRLLLSQGAASDFHHGWGTRTIDYVLIRAYSATPPAAITFSGEQSIPAPPIAGFRTTPAHTLTVICTDLSLGPTSWHWDFGDGRTSTEQNPTHTYASPGTYTITLTVTNAHGTDTHSTTLHVATPSSVSFTYTVDGPELSTGVPIHFQGLISSDATSWRWYFGDGATSEERNPTHTYSKTGTYRVTLTATNEYGSISFSQNLHVFTGTIADPTPPPTHGSAFKWDPETGYYTSYWFNREGSFIDVHGLFFALMLPLTQIFGSWVFLIIWGTLCMGLYLYTQDTTMPFIVGILGGSMMAFLMGEDALVVMLLTMAFAGGGILAKVLLGRV